MGTSSKEFVVYVMEQLGPLKDVKTGRFFGGVGLKSADRLFGMIMGNVLYFVVDETTRPAYQDMGSRCFSYSTKRGPVEVHRFYEVPADRLEDSEACVELAKQSIEVVRGAAKPRKQSTRKRKRSVI